MKSQKSNRCMIVLTATIIYRLIVARDDVLPEDFIPSAITMSNPIGPFAFKTIAERDTKK